MSSTPQGTATSLSSLFASPAMGRLVVHFLLHPHAAVHLRELRRVTDLSISSLQNELRRLTEMGAVTRTEEGHRVLYRAEDSHPVWTGWRQILRACADPAEVLREALVGVPGIEGAFLFGSTARGDARPDSDIDLLVIGSEEARRGLRPAFTEAEYLLDRDLDVVGYGREELRHRLHSGNSFVRRVMEERKKWIVGGPQALGEEVTT